MKIEFELAEPEAKNHSTKYTQSGDVRMDGALVDRSEVFHQSPSLYIPKPFGKRGARRLKVTIEEIL